MWWASPSRSCRVCVPGGNSITASVCPLPKCRMGLRTHCMVSLLAWTLWSANRHGYFLRVERRLVRHVVRVAEQQLQRMRSWRQFDPCFGLPFAEMQVVFVVGDRLVQRWQV